MLLPPLLLVTVVTLPVDRFCVLGIPTPIPEVAAGMFRPVTFLSELLVRIVFLATCFLEAEGPVAVLSRVSVALDRTPGDIPLTSDIIPFVTLEVLRDFVGGSATLVSPLGVVALSRLKEILSCPIECLPPLLTDIDFPWTN